VDLTAGHIGELIAAASAAQDRMCVTIGGMTGAQCREPSLLPGWSRAHVLTHWARNADGQCRMLAAAQRGEIARQYPGGDAQRAADIDAGAARPPRVIVADARAAAQRAEAMWRSMPSGAWLRPTAARAGRRPAWMSVWARWRETDIHHLDLGLGYTHRDWPAAFVDLLLPRLLAGLDRRLPPATSVAIRVTDRAGPARWPEESDGEPVTVTGPASAVTCWLLGRTAAATSDLTVARSGQPCPAPQLRPWA
jgi:maleylpyruvate isomerase